VAYFVITLTIILAVWPTSNSLAYINSNQRDWNQPKILLHSAPIRQRRDRN